MGEAQLASRRVSFLGAERTVYGGAACDYFARLPDRIHEFDGLLGVLRAAGFRPQRIVDVGANVGLFALYFAEAFPEAEIEAYEPHPEAFAALQANTADLPRARVRRLALSDRPGEAAFRPGGPVIRARSSGSHLVADPAAREAGFDIVVETSTLDAETPEDAEGAPTLVKIDVEGFEPDVLRGATRLARSAAAVFYVEFNSFALIALRDLNPRVLLEQMLDSFAFVYSLDPERGLVRIEGASGRLAFLQANLIRHACIDDLVAANVDLRR